jgi:lactose/L-arabinose transport system substrate-binding protein
MKKKVLSILMTAMMALSLAACGNADNSAAPVAGTDSQTQASTESAKTEAEAPATEGEQTLKVWCWDSFNVDAMKTAGAMYEAEHPGVSIVVEETLSKDIQTIVQTCAMSGQLDSLPDVFLMDDQVFTKYLQNYPEVFADLTDSGIAFSDFAASKVANSVSGGKNFGVPYDSNTVIACYRTDYLEQAGYTVADLTNITWDQFIEIGKVVKEKTGMPMLTNVQGEPDLLNMILQSAGISVFDEDGKIDLVDNEGLKEAMEVYMTLVKEGILQE